MQELVEYIEQFVHLDANAKRDLMAFTETETFEKNQYLLKKGQCCSKVWFLKKGLVRKFHFNDSEEVTTWIHTENTMLTSLQSYVQQSFSDEYIQACEAVETISITKENSEKLAKHPQFMAFSNALLVHEFANVDKHTKALNERDAKGKYEYLLRVAPEIIKRAKVGHVASVLGMSRETLSRVRRR